MLALKQDFIEFCRQRQLFGKGDRVLVACSGGSDSVALLRLLESTKNLFGISIFCGHVDHCLRPGSHNDAEFVRAVCDKLSIPFALERISDAPAGNLEDWARTWRRTLLEKMAIDFGCNKIAIAHNANDKAETLLHNLARGSGLYGAANMRSQHGNTIRPLLFAGKRVILHYLGELGQGYVTDETNDDTRFSRNMIRARVIPELESIFPETVANISRFSELACDESSFLDDLTRDFMKSVLSGNSLSVSKFSIVPKVLKPRIVRLIVDSKHPPSLSACTNTVEFIETSETGKHLTMDCVTFNKISKNIVNILFLHDTDQRL